MNALFKRIGIWIGIGLFLLIMSCTNDMSKTIMEVDNKEVVTTQQIPANVDDVVLVDSEQAINVAEAFWGNFTDNTVNIRTGKLEKNVSKTSDISIETVMDNDTPLMYIINYPDGGFAIISANRNYYPVLAYSDKNNFILDPEIETLWFWIESEKEAIRECNSLVESTKEEIRALWRFYEPKLRTDLTDEISTRAYSTEIAAYNARKAALESALSSSGWTIYALPAAQYAMESSVWSNLYSMAGNNAYSQNYSIVGIKNVSGINPNVGPLLSTAWHQVAPTWSPTGTSCNAGCVTVAIAQIMNYYNWSYSNVNDLYLSIGKKLGLNYSSCDVGATFSQAKSAFQSFGYNASSASHSATTVRDQLLANKPVFMGGYTSGGNGHAWVCDGTQWLNFSTNYFVEFLSLEWWLYGGYDYTWFSGSSSSPNTCSNSTNVYFYMNWGFSGSGNGWFLDSNPNAPTGLYNKNRENVYANP